MTPVINPTLNSSVSHTVTTAQNLLFFLRLPQALLAWSYSLTHFTAIHSYNSDLFLVVATAPSINPILKKCAPFPTL